MEEREQRNQLPCIVDEGIVYQRKDMARILRDLGQVRYVDYYLGVERASGEGYLASVTTNNQSGTVIVNGRLYINTSCFDFLQIGKGQEDPVFLDLVDGERIIRIIPFPEAADAPRPRAAIEPSIQPCLFDRYLDETLAEVYLDDEGDEDDD
ncbi:MAG TPA: hypothetical protein DD435_03350 [Cyanobacteria bacterium UBA8530]|nr:hypothetical protein [Cyanobacteria bacterium UBA8530]